MEMLSITSAPSVTAQTMSTQMKSTSGPNGSTSFQKQLNQYVNQTDSTTANATQTEATTDANVVNIDQAEETTLTAEQLMTLVESLIEQIEQLTDVPLTNEDVAALEELSLQLIAVLQLITVDQNPFSDTSNQFTQSSTALLTQLSETEVNNELLFKLQDQLLLLQQALKDGNLKVAQGQQPEHVLTQVVSKMKQLLDMTKQNSKELLVQQLSGQVHVNDDIVTQNLANSSLEQLKQLAKQAEYLQLANQTTTTSSSVASQVVEATPVFTMQNSIPFSAQLAQSVFVQKATTQQTTFTMVNQFSDTVKTMVMQKFDLSQLSNGLSHARIMLSPEHLGSVDIKLSLQNGVLTAVFAAETAMAKDALENQMSVLRGSLAAQGIIVDRMEVTQTSFSEELNWEEQRQQQASAESHQDDTDDESFEEKLEASDANQELGLGRAVNEMV